MRNQKNEPGEGKNIEHATLPEQYIDNNLSEGKIGEDYLLVFLQNELREVLQSFLNGGFSRMGFALYPLVRDVSLENQEKLERLHTIAEFLNRNSKGEMEFGKSAAFSSPLVSAAQCAGFLAALSRDFAVSAKKKTSQVKKNACGGFTLAEYGKRDHHYLKPVVGLMQYAKKNLSDDALGFYLHGSLATNDFVKGWSDCDTLLVVKGEAVQDQKRLLALRKKVFSMRRFFFRMDPLQHHGCMLCAEHDLDFYSNAYFPLPLFSYAKSLVEDGITTISRRETGTEKYSKLFWLVQYFRKMREENVKALSSYDAKNLLHLIALFPSLYLGAKDVLVYKKFSFGMAKKDFGKDLWKPIEMMTEVRNAWKPFPELPPVRIKALLNPVAAYQINAALGDAVFRMKKKNPVPVQGIVEGMGLLAEEAWSKIRKRI